MFCGAALHGALAHVQVEYTGSCDELFINQMIPHHQNAVNMAKTTLKYAESALTTACVDENGEPIDGTSCPDYAATDLLRSIIQSQNAEIQYMRHYLETIPGARDAPEPCQEPDDDDVDVGMTANTNVVAAMTGLVVALAMAA